MPIISISLNENIIEELDKLQKFLGFSGRSEIVRASVRNLLLEEKRIDELSGVLHSVLLVIHDEKSDQEISEIRHGFDKIINTHIHNKIDKDRCLEIFVLYGDAREIKNITKKFQVNRKMDQVRLVVTWYLRLLSHRWDLDPRPKVYETFALPGWATMAP